jgi:hypothetical protein
MIKGALVVVGGLVGAACYLHGPQICEHLVAMYNQWGL